MRDPNSTLLHSIFARIPLALGLSLWFLSLPVCAVSQQSSEPLLSTTDPLQLRWRFELFAGLGLNAHSGNPFGVNPVNLPIDAPAFESAVSPSAAFALSFSPLEYRFSAELALSAGVEIGYSDFSTEFSSIETTDLIVQGVPTSGSNEHLVSLNMRALSFQPHLTLQFRNWYLRTGPQLLLPINDEYDQTEEILSPAGSEFPEGGTIRQITEDDEQIVLDGGSFGLDLALGYEFYLNSAQQLSLSPEIRIQPRSYSFDSDVDWSARAIQLGARLAWRPAESEEVILLRDTVFVRDTVTTLVDDLAAESVVLRNQTQTLERDTLSSTRIILRSTIRESYLRRIPQPESLLVVALEAELEDGSGQTGANITLDMDLIDEQIYVPISTNWYSSAMPAARLIGKTAEIWQLATPDQDLDVLDSIGHRLQSRHRAELTIETDELDLFNELQAWMQKQWEIEPQRILHRSVSAGTDGSRPGVRARLSSSQSAILAPLRLQRNSARMMGPVTVRFIPYVLAEAGMYYWRLGLFQATGKKLQFYERTGFDLPEEIEWRIPSVIIPAILSGGGQLQGKLWVVDGSGARKMSDPVELSFSRVSKSDTVVGSAYRVGINLDSGSAVELLEPYRSIMQDEGVFGLMYSIEPAMNSGASKILTELVDLIEKRNRFVKIHAAPTVLAARASENNGQAVTGRSQENANLVWLIFKPGNIVSRK